MTLALAPLWCLVLLALLLLAAAVEDSIRLRISNRTTLAVLILTIVTMFVVGPRLDLWQNVAVFVVLLVVGTVMFAAGKLGGGDVKLLAVCGLWFSLAGAITMLIAVFLAGGFLAAFILLGRALRKKEGPSRVVFLNPGSGIPYGIAIAIGVLGAIAWQRIDAAKPAADPFGLPPAISTL